MPYVSTIRLVKKEIQQKKTNTPYLLQSLTALLSKARIVSKSFFECLTFKCFHSETELKILLIIIEV